MAIGLKQQFRLRFVFNVLLGKQHAVYTRSSLSCPVGTLDCRNPRPGCSRAKPLALVSDDYKFSTSCTRTSFKPASFQPCNQLLMGFSLQWTLCRSGTALSVQLNTALVGVSGGSGWSSLVRPVHHLSRSRSLFIDIPWEHGFIDEQPRSSLVFYEGLVDPLV